MSSRTRTRSRIASSAGLGTRIAVSSPARCKCARLRASIRSVLTRPPARRGIIVGATTSHGMPSALSKRLVLVAGGAGLVAGDCVFQAPAADQGPQSLRSVHDRSFVRFGFAWARRPATAIVSLCTSKPRCVALSMAGPPPCVAPRAAHPRVIHNSSRSDRPSHRD